MLTDQSLQLPARLVVVGLAPEDPLVLYGCGLIPPLVHKDPGQEQTTGHLRRSESNRPPGMTFGRLEIAGAARELRDLPPELPPAR